MAKKSKFPPLWSLPIILRQIPPMLWAQRRKDYERAMEIGRYMMGSAKIKTKVFAGYTPTPHDVFVCTYSKSGTYWMMQVVTQIAGRGAAEFEHIHDLVPWPEALMPGLVRLQEPTWQEVPTQLRAVKTHAEVQFVPYNEQAKYVVVMRDPKDVIVSSFYFSDSIVPGLSSMGLTKWMETFVAGEVPYGSWPEHIAGFWPWRDRDNVEVVTFGEMKRDLTAVVERIAAFMGVTLTPAELAAVVERSGFAYMKAAEDKFRPLTPSVNATNVNLIRRGDKGEAAELLTAAQLAQVDAAMKAELVERGSDFPYDDYFG